MYFINILVFIIKLQSSAHGSYFLNFDNDTVLYNKIKYILILLVNKSRINIYNLLLFVINV